MISNVMETLHSYNGTPSRFLRLTDWDRKLARAMISIVDDDAFVRESLRDLIESLGYDVAPFESAERFLEAACLVQTSCLITDLQMPGLSGLDLQGRLIADGHCIPIIFVTGLAAENFRVRAMSAGAVGFLSKPLDERLLISCLETALSPSIGYSRPRSRSSRRIDSGIAAAPGATRPKSRGASLAAK